jgi:glycosyltransferase involved in cell wall biosynthesis
VPFLNALASDSRVDLEVFFFAKTEERRSWRIPWDNIRFGYRLLNGFLVARRYQRGPILFNPGIWTALNRGGYGTIVCFGYHHPTIWLALLWSRWSGARILLWCESTLRDARSSGRLMEGLKRRLVRRFDGYVAAGSRQVEYLEHLGAPRERIWVSPDSVDSAFFESESERFRVRRDEIRREMGIEGPVVLYVGRLLDAKGIMDLLEAFRGLIRERKATLILVGDGPDRERYESFCRERGLSDIRFEGFREQEELPRYYGIADVLVFPTHSDPWGLVLNEAMSAGLPVICSAAGSDVVRDGVDGFVVPIRDADSIKDRLLRLKNDPDLARRMGESGRERVLAFGWAAYKKSIGGAIARMNGAAGCA